MCGIAGAVWTDPRWAVSADTLRRMTDALAHRGPDDQGTYTSELRIDPPYSVLPGVALGHRRLSIIDLPGSRQPMANEDGSVQLVFNGEIYNFRELRLRLEGSGHQFRSAGDTEVLVHLYEDEGVDFVQHLIGMFAIAIWDRNHRRVVLARDRLGQKPLVYQWQNGRLLFASELKSLLAVPDIAREIDPSALDEYLLYQYVPYPNTIFRGIRKLPPGHVAVLEDNRFTVRPYWQPDFNEESSVGEGETIEQLRTTLTEAVRSQLESDVPLGAFLSGGVDSSVVVALMQQQAAAPVKTFTVGFPEREYDETEFARRVAAHLGTEHHELRVEPDIIDLLPKLAWQFDEPFGDSSAVPTYYLAQQTRGHVTVALSGDGGDELFAGYDRYRAMRLAAAIDRLPWRLRAVVANKLWQRLPAPGRQKSLRLRMKRLAAALAAPQSRRYPELISIFNESRRAALYSDEFLSRLPNQDPADFVVAAMARASKRDVATAASLADLITYLPCDLCHKVDMATMAVGLECRQPMLDHRVVELAVAMPMRMKLHGRHGKRILERAFGEMLPREVFHRRKMGFGVPLDHWFRGPLKTMAHDTLLSTESIDRGYFRRPAIEQLLAEHAGGRADHSARLWSLLMLELWHRQWVDR
jgi:asparagine synthase (glutamine-hydrolysing)